MAVDAKMLSDVKAFLERQRLEHTESEEQYCLKLEVRSGVQRAFIRASSIPANCSCKVPPARSRPSWRR